MTDYIKENQGRRVVVKPIIVEGWPPMLAEQNRNKFDGTYDFIMALYSKSLGRLATGLSQEEETYFARELGVESLSPTSTNEFWHDFRIKMEDRAMIFNMAKPRDYLAVKLLEASDLVANSLAEFNKGKWPSARYVIYDETQELEQENAQIDKKVRALQLFQEMTPAKRIRVLKVYGKSPALITPEMAYKRCYELVEDDPERFTKTATMDDEEMMVRALMFDLERAGVLRREGPAVLYNDQRIGFDYEDAVRNLLHPKSQELVLKFKELVESRGLEYQAATYKSAEALHKHYIDAEMKKAEKSEEKRVATRRRKKADTDDAPSISSETLEAESDE